MTNRQIWPEDIQPVERLSFSHIEKRYTKVIVIRLVLVYLILMALALIIPTLGLNNSMVVFATAECILATAFAVNVALLHKIYQCKGYALREKDISYRSGIFFETVKTIPFNKIQQVSIRLNPVSRIFGLYYLDVINGSQAAVNSVTVPGLSLEKAEQLKTLLINNTDRDND